LNKNHSTGVKNELKAASYFAGKGFEVYWPMHTQSRCDFIIYKNEYFNKVQVKTATWSKTGEHLYLQCRLKNRNKYGTVYLEGDFDWIVFIDGERMWATGWEEVEGLSSVCLDSTNPNYNPRDKDYNPADWLV